MGHTSSMCLNRIISFCVIAGVTVQGISPRIASLQQQISELQHAMDQLSGVIVMWQGNPELIPVGWVLCNGNAGTPDLSDKFIVGAGGQYSVGGQGGSSSYSLTVDQLPAHTHDAEQAGEHHHDIEYEF